MVCAGNNAISAFQGDDYDDWYREVLQRSKRLRLHRAGRRRPGRVRACLSGRTRRNARPRRGAEDHVRHRSRSQERQVGSDQPADGVNASRRYGARRTRAGFFVACNPLGPRLFPRRARAFRRNKNIARKPGTRASGEYVLFNVIYEDGTQRSNRKVPAELLGGLDGDEPARAVIEAQDRDISAKSGMAPLKIKKVVRADAKEKAREGMKEWKLAR